MRYSGHVTKGRNTGDFAASVTRSTGSGLMDWTQVAFRVFPTRKEANAWLRSTLAKLN